MADEAVVVAENLVVDAFAIDHQALVLVDDLGGEPGEIGHAVPGMVEMPADLRVAFVIDERQAGEARMVLADIVDRHHLVPDDRQAVRRQILGVLPGALLVHRDEIQPHAGLAGEQVGAGVAMGEEAFEDRRDAPGDAGAAELERGIDRLQCFRAGVVVVVESGLAAELPPDVRLVPGLEIPGAQFVSAVAGLIALRHLAHEVTPVMRLADVVEIAVDIGGIAHQLEEGPDAVLQHHVDRRIEPRPIVLAEA